MPAKRIAQSLLLPEQRLLDAKQVRKGIVEIYVEKTSEMEVCPKCATPSTSVYDRRWVCVRDEPLRARTVLLYIRKRRFLCKSCRRPFTEPVQGIRKYGRTTERYRKAVLNACERFSDLKSVQKVFRCSAGYLFRTLYAELERRLKMFLLQWPRELGIDEHFFRRKGPRREFVTMVVDMKGRRLMEVVEGKRVSDLRVALEHIPGRERVHWIALDLAAPYKTFCQEFFPEAQLVADKFHVLRLLNPAINRARKAITGDIRSVPLRRWLLRPGRKLLREDRARLLNWLREHPELNQLYHAKESMHGFYRIRNRKRAAKVLTKITDTLALSDVPELKTFRRTLMTWRKEILAYFERRSVTNARTEGFNGKAKLVKRRAYGFRSFRNYRLRLLNACC